MHEHHGDRSASEQPIELRGQAAEDALNRIRARLSRDLPPGPYVADSDLAAILGVSLKTLANDRASARRRYPIPIRLGNGRRALHPRDELIDWMARQELMQRARSVHRCR